MTRPDPQPIAAFRAAGSGPAFAQGMMPGHDARHLAAPYVKCPDASLRGDP
jgi:hypothetical protein